MKIALINDSFPPTIDGVSNAVENYASILHKNGNTPVVVTPKYPHVVDNYPFEVFRYSSVNLLKSMPYRVGNPLSPALFNDLVKHNFDIIHNHCPLISGLVAHDLSRRPVFRHTPMVFTYHTKYDIDIDRIVHNKSLNKLAKRIILRNINAADEVWTVSSGAIENLRGFGYTGEVTVMENGTDFTKLPPDKDVLVEVKRMYNFDADVPVFLYVGRMMWYKNIKLILDTYKELSDAGINFCGVFVGDGPDKAAIEQYAKNAGIKDLCLFVGPVTERERVKSFFTCATLLFFPSTFDTSGLVVKEAAACNCPSLLVKGSCAAERVVSGQNGILANEDAGDCAAKIAAALRQSGALKQMGIAASNELYRTWEETVNESQKRYEALIERHNKKTNKKKKQHNYSGQG